MNFSVYLAMTTHRPLLAFTQRPTANQPHNHDPTNHLQFTYTMLQIIVL